MRDHEIQQLTAEYARFSRSAGGLAATLGGLLCLASWLAGGLLPPSPLLRALLVATPIVWLIAKQLASRRYYQRFGRVEERPSPAELWTHRLVVAVTALISVVIVGGVAWQTLRNGTPLTWRIAGYALVVAALPVLVWRYLRHSLDFIVGTFLICQAAVAVAGGAYSLVGVALVFPPVAVVMIVAGIVEHRRYRRIESRLLLARRAS